MFNVIDDYKREGIAIQAELSLLLERLLEWRNKPIVICVIMALNSLVQSLPSGSKIKEYVSSIFN